MPRYFFTKLNPPRASFAQDMNEDERRFMGEHAVYWKALAEKGVALLFGPVGDPKGVYGICITQADSENEINALTANDPIIRVGLGFTVETYPLLDLVRGRQATQSGPKAQS